jgi:hypothetical protein
MQDAEGHSRVSGDLEGFNLSLLRLHVEMGGLLEIDFIAVDGL